MDTSERQKDSSGKQNGNSGNERAVLIFGKRSHWLEDKGTYNLMFYI